MWVRLHVCAHMCVDSEHASLIMSNNCLIYRNLTNLYGCMQVTWSPEAARRLHVLPLVAAVAVATAVGFPLASLAAGAARVLASIALCLLLPALMGALRVAVFGA